MLHIVYINQYMMIQGGAMRLENQKIVIKTPIKNISL